MWCGVAWHVVWCGLACAVVWCGVVWFGIWCGVAWCSMVWHDGLLWCGVACLWIWQNLKTCFSVLLPLISDRVYDTSFWGNMTKSEKLKNHKPKYAQAIHGVNA